MRKTEGLHGGVRRRKGSSLSGGKGGRGERVGRRAVDGARDPALSVGEMSSQSPHSVLRGEESRSSACDACSRRRKAVVGESGSRCIRSGSWLLLERKWNALLLRLQSVLHLRILLLFSLGPVPTYIRARVSLGRRARRESVARGAPPTRLS